MASGGFPPNPYSQGSPYQQGTPQPMYRSQQPRFQRSPRPRFHQQYVPHHTGPSPRGERFQSPLPPRFPEGNFQWTPSPRIGSPSPRRGGPGGYRGSPYRGRGGRRGGGDDCNPGSSDDISQYYSPAMVEDPWAGLKPVPLNEHSNFTT